MELPSLDKHGFVLYGYIHNTFMNDDFGLDDLSKIEGFEWDSANIDKNREKHHTEPKESEEVFFNKPIIFLKDPKHSTKNERRFGVLGKTNEERKLEIYFTLRNNKIRIIAAWDMNKRGRAVYINYEEREKRGENKNGT